MDIKNIALAADKITVTMMDDSMMDFMPSAAPITPTQTVEVHAGEIVEVKGV